MVFSLEFRTAGFANERSVVRMYYLVLYQICKVCKSFPTRLTQVGIFLCMCTLVRIEVELQRKPFPAHSALEGAIFLMNCLDVPLQCRKLSKRRAACVAGMWSCVCVDEGMSLKLRRVTEGFVAH